MENKRLFVFTLATNVYNNYIPAQLETWGNAFPNIDDKKLIIISDKKYDFSDNEDIFSVRIPNIHYNLMCVSKFSYCLYALDELGLIYDSDDMFLFVDADTKYLERPIEVWETVSNLLSTYDLVVNPYLVFGHESHGKQMCIDWGEDDKQYAGYYDVTDDNINICTNILGGSILMLRILVHEIYQMLDHDLNIEKNHRHFPCINEETYVNKIVNDHINGDRDNYKICVTMLHCVPYGTNSIYYDYLGSIENQMNTWQDIIILSKYNNNFKTKTMPKWNKKSQITI